MENSILRKNPKPVSFNEKFRDTPNSLRCEMGRYFQPGLSVRIGPLTRHTEGSRTLSSLDSSSTQIHLHTKVLNLSGSKISTSPNKPFYSSLKTFSELKNIIIISKTEACSILLTSPNIPIYKFGCMKIDRFGAFIWCI